MGPLERIQITRPASAHTEVPSYLLPEDRGLLLSTASTYWCGLTELQLTNVDTDWPNGDRAGIRVARSPASARGEDFRVWRNGFWYPALPSGLTKSTMDQFYDTQSPTSTPILGLGRNSASFQVARRLDGLGFLGLEQWFDSGGRAHIGIRESTNLVKWTARTALGVRPAPFNSFSLSYPIFLNAAKHAHTRVGDSFYVLGTQGTQVHRLAVHEGP